MADAEEEPEVVVGELYVFGFGGVQEGLDFGEGFAGDEDAFFAADAFEGLLWFFDEGEAVAVGGDHGDRLGLEDEEGAVEGVAGLFVGDREDGAGDEGFEDGSGDLDAGYGGQLWDGGVVGAAEADHLGVGAAGADLDPVVVEELEGDVAVLEELDVVVEFAGGDGAGAGLFDFDFAARADGVVEVGGGDGKLAAFGGFSSLDEEVGEDGDGRFALDDALDGGEFFEQVLPGDGDFHDCSLNGCRGGRGGGHFDVGFKSQSWHVCLSSRP